MRQKLRAEPRRERSEATRRRLIDATLDSIANHGLGNTTVATVAQNSGLSPGLVAFHFQNKEQLVTESLAYLVNLYKSGWVRILGNPNMTPAERIRAVLDREFSTAWFNQKTVAIWYGFWGGVPTRPTYRHICRDAERALTTAFAEHFRLIIREGAYGDIDADAVAQGLSALLMGLYLDYGFDPDDFNRQRAKKICISYLSGFFPKHFSHPWKPTTVRGLGSSAAMDKARRGAHIAKKPASGTRPASEWGVNSEYGRLSDVVMVSPVAPIPGLDAMRPRATFYSPGLGSEANAQAEHNGLRTALEAAGVRVHLIEPDARLSMQTCVQDIGFLTPFGAIVAPPVNGRRIGEIVHLIRFYQESNVPLYGTVTAGPMEGGNVLFVRPGSVLLGCAAEHDSIAATMQVAGWFENEGWETRTVLLPAPFTRLDSLMSILSDTLALVRNDVLAMEISDWLEQHGFSLVHAEAAEAAGAVLSVAEKKLFLPTTVRALSDRLKSIGLDVVEVELSAFASLGISLRRLVHPLRREVVKS